MAQRSKSAEKGAQGRELQSNSEEFQRKGTRESRRMFEQLEKTREGKRDRRKEKLTEIDKRIERREKAIEELRREIEEVSESFVEDLPRKGGEGRDREWRGLQIHFWNSLND